MLLRDLIGMKYRTLPSLEVPVRQCRPWVIDLILETESGTCRASFFVYCRR